MIPFLVAHLLFCDAFENSQQLEHIDDLKFFLKTLVAVAEFKIFRLLLLVETTAFEALFSEEVHYI